MHNINAMLMIYYKNISKFWKKGLPVVRNLFIIVRIKLLYLWYKCNVNDFTTEMQCQWLKYRNSLQMRIVSGQELMQE